MNCQELIKKGQRMKGEVTRYPARIFFSSRAFLLCVSEIFLYNGGKVLKGKNCVSRE